jgi:hypothetical protein
MQHAKNGYEKMCSETTIMFSKQTHTRTCTVHTLRSGIIMKRSSFQTDKITLMGAVGICNDMPKRNGDKMY